MTRHRLILFLLCLLPLSSLALAETSLWRVSKGQQLMFIGGTVHVLSADDYPLPEAYDRAYAQADVLVFETDMQAINSAQFQQQMLQRLTYADGQTLKGALQDATYEALAAYGESRGLPMTLLDRFRPAMVSLVIVMTELQRLGIDGTGVDDHYYQRARRDGKPTRQLESAQAQLDYIAGMGRGQEDALILNSLRDAEHVSEMMREIKAAWRSGDQAQLARVGLEPMRADYPQLFQNLLVKRNNAWLSRLEQMLKAPDTKLVLVGALHLVGDEGVLAQLRERGYTITQQ